MSLHYVRRSRWWVDCDTVRTRYPHAVVSAFGGLTLDAQIAWCRETLEDTDAATEIRNHGDVVYEVDLNGIWVLLDGEFRFKDPVHAMAFKMRWG